MPASHLLALQRSAGNAAVGRMLQRAADAALDLKPVKAGDDPLDLKQQNAIRFIHNELKPDEVRKIKKDVLDARVNQAVAAAGMPIPAATQADVLASFKAGIDAHPHDNSWAAYNASWTDPTTKTNEHYALINQLFSQLKAEFVPAVRTKYARLDIEIEQRLSRLDKLETLPDDKKAGWAAALRSMAGFGALVRQIKSDNKAVQDAPKNLGAKQREWADGASLSDNVTEVDGPGAPLDTDLKNGTFAKKVKEVDDFYKALLEPEVMTKIKRPKIMVHKTMSADMAWKLQAEEAKKPQPKVIPDGFGGYQAGGEVHVGQDVFREILTHEVGHHIENSLPRDRWQDIHLVMRGRMKAKGGTGKMAAGQSPRLEGDYPVTGPYTSTTYNDDVGGTEFTAMTVQYLSDKKDLDAILDGDPQQVAVLVRALRPKEYRDHAPLRAFDKYLPS